MNVTLTLDDALVKRLRKVAAEQETTLTAMVREYLERVAPAQVPAAEQRRRREAMEESFRILKVNSGGKRWTREERNERTPAPQRKRRAS